MTSDRRLNIPMRPGRLFWKLFLGNVLLIALVLSACLWLIAREIQQSQDQELTRHLTSQAIALRGMLEDRFDAAHADQLNDLIKRVERDLPGPVRITLVLADGTVLADSENDPTSMESHADRPEIIQALAQNTGEDVRMSHTLGRNLKYIAVAVGLATHSPRGVVRVAMPVRTISEQAGLVQRLIWGTGFLAMLAAVTLALGLAQIWSRPIRRITLAARALSHGDLTAEVRVGGADELAILARSLNEMRARLTGHLETIDRQRRTLESLLSQLHEGVVVAGSDGRIVLMNPAAAKMLGLRPDSAEIMTRLAGQPIEVSIAQYELQQMLLPRAARPAADREPEGADTIREVRLASTKDQPEATVLARASDMLLPAFEPDRPRSSKPGRLLVLTDVSQLTRLIQVKADFAANASHELRTPLSAIRASLETLLQMDLVREADAARRFIDAIHRQSQRLEMLVSDLLELSRLESSRIQFQPVEIRLSEMVADIGRQRTAELTQKSLHWEVDLSGKPGPISADPRLLRIVLENLVDNSIKFTEPGGHVRIVCRDQPRAGDRPPAVEISVSDDGCGIALEEQARVFERFYQVERARSGGVLRGTGLGLSIVRHAALAMKGSLELHSELGKGTRISLTIPQPA